MESSDDLYVESLDGLFAHFFSNHLILVKHKEIVK